MVGGCGGFDMGGWIWWPVVLGCERETEERETEKERGRIKKRIKIEYLNKVVKKLEVLM